MWERKFVPALFEDRDKVEDKPSELERDKQKIGCLNSETTEQIIKRESWRDRRK